MFISINRRLLAVIGVIVHLDIPVPDARIGSIFVHPFCAKTMELVTPPGHHRLVSAQKDLWVIDVNRLYWKGLLHPLP